MKDGERKAPWGLVMLLLGWCFVIQGRLAFLEGRATFFHGAPTPAEVRK